MADERVTKTETTEVVKKKNSQKLWQTMFSFDPQEVKNTVVNKIVIPGVNNLISTTLKSIIDGIFKTNGSYSGYSSTPSSSYQSYYNSGTVQKLPSKILNPMDENIWIRDESAARDIVTEIKMTIAHNGFATVGQLYDRAHLTVPYTAEYWGWTTFNAGVVPGKNAKGEDGWVIVTPPAMEIHRS